MSILSWHEYACNSHPRSFLQYSNAFVYKLTSLKMPSYGFAEDGQVCLYSVPRDTVFS